jgi:diguanylate cyclase (GGDEF)-like protein/PAS domain S-box-containing protein
MQFFRHSVLAVKVLQWVLLVSLVVFAVATAFGFAHERQKALELAHASAQDAAQQSIAGISNALWQYDVAGLNALLSGMVTSRVVVRAEVLGLDKQVAEVIAPGFSGTVDRVWSVPVLAPDQPTRIGTLRISEPYAQANVQIADTLQILVLTDLAKIVGLALVLIIIVYRTITRHLRQLASAVAELGHSEYAPKLSVARKASRFYRDEIDTLVDAINRFVAERGEEISRRSAAEEERQLAIVALAQSEENLAITLHSIGDAVIATDAAGRVTRMNPTAERLTGWLLDEAMDQPLSEVFRVVDATTGEAITDPVQQVKAHGQVVGLANHRLLLAKGGQQYQIADSADPICNAEGAIVGVVLMFSDVTEKYRSDEALRIAATAFESQQGMFITNAHRVILRVNQAFTTITGYSAQEAVGQTTRMLSSGRHDGTFYVVLMKSLSNLGTWAGKIWNRRKNGEVYPEWLTISAVKDNAGLVTHYVAIFNDISERVRAQAQIDTLAFYDPLTQLPNRRLLLDRLEQALHVSTRHARKSALLFVDLDNFKTINDTLGHFQGGALLVQLAQRLKTCIREGDTVARLGSDEFVVMLEDLSEDDIEAATQAEVVADNVLAAFVPDFTLDSGAHHGTPSIGITLFGGQTLESSEQPLQRAELAMFQAKAAGRNTLRFFDARMQAKVSARAALETDFREAVYTQHFVLAYQAHHRGGGAIALATPAARCGVAGQIHSAGRRNRPDFAHRPMGARDRLRATCGLGATARAGKTEHGRERERTPIFGDWFCGPRVARAGAERCQCHAAQTVADREYVGGRCGGRHRQDVRAQSPWRGLLTGRLWHRLLVAGLPQAPVAGPTQDRPGLCAQHRH